MKPVRVLIVDDSAVVRQALSHVLSRDSEIEIIATAADPFIAADRIQEQVPDVIVLDVEMPRMDGITFLQTIMKQRPIPVVICSTLTERGSATALRALECGAVDVIAKPRLGTEEFIRESSEQLCAAVKSASTARLRVMRPVEPALTADAVLPQAAKAMVHTTEKVVLVGASTGGTEALRVLLTGMPPDAPGLVIVQHMPEKFTRAFADRLDSLCAISVKEAENGDPVLRGRALIAPGNRHTLLKRSGARYAGSNAVGVLLTGMGNDGAHGLLELKQSGALTFAEDESSCVVFGMPNEAIKLGAAARILPLHTMGTGVLAACH